MLLTAVVLFTKIVSYILASDVVIEDEDVLQEWEWSDRFWNDHTPVQYILDPGPPEDWDDELQKLYNIL